MPDLKLDYLCEAKNSIGRIYEGVSDTDIQPDPQAWIQVAAEALVSIADSLSILAYREYR